MYREIHRRPAVVVFLRTVDRYFPRVDGSVRGGAELLYLGGVCRVNVFGMSAPVPSGLTELLKGYTLEVLRRRPADLLEFAVLYFTRLREQRSSARRSPVTRGEAFDRSSSGGEEEQRHEEEEEEEQRHEEEEEEEEEDEDDFPDYCTFKGGRRTSCVFLNFYFLYINAYYKKNIP